MKPVRVLCLDLDSGLGGSSRSLYEVLRCIDRRLVAPEVWTVTPSPFADGLGELGIPVKTVGPLPKFKAAPKLSRSLAAYVLASVSRFRNGARIRQLTADARRRFELVHINGDSGLFLARTFSSIGLPVVAHIRSILPQNGMARLQVRALGRSVAAMIFITENEEARFRSLGCRTPGRVIYNVAEKRSVENPDAPSQEPGFWVSSVGYFHWNKGTDRLVDVAEILRARNRTDIRFLVAGRMQLTSDLPGRFGQLGRAGADFNAYVRERELDHWFHFLGQVSDPATVLARASAAIRPSREKQPWSRDIIEAMAWGRPVLTCGTYDRFVETGKTGYLYDSFDASQCAEDIVRLADDPGLVKRLGDAAQEKIQDLCNGRDRAADLAGVWQTYGGTATR